MMGDPIEFCSHCGEPFVTGSFHDCLDVEEEDEAEWEPHECEAEGCEAMGFGVGGSYEDGPDFYLCKPHAREAGACYSCGQYFNGEEGFNSSGMCDECELDEEMEDDADDLYMDWDEDYDEDDPLAIPHDGD